MPCEICKRQARGVQYKGRKACSMEHMKLLGKDARNMIDATKHETAAALHGGTFGGQYLDSIGQTDLAKLQPDQWQQFLLCVIGGYHEKLIEIE